MQVELPDTFIVLSDAQALDVATEVSDMSDLSAVPESANLAHFRTHTDICRLMELPWEEWFKTVLRLEQERLTRLWDTYAVQIAEIRNNPEEQARREALWDQYAEKKAKWDADPKLRNSEPEPTPPEYEWKDFLAPDVYIQAGKGDVRGYVMVDDEADFAPVQEPPEPPRPFRCVQWYGRDIVCPGEQEPNPVHLLHGAYWILAIIHDRTRLDQPRIIQDYDPTKEEQAEPWPESMKLDLLPIPSPLGLRFTVCYVRYALRAVRADLDRLSSQQEEAPPNKRPQQNDTEKRLPRGTVMAEVQARAMAILIKHPDWSITRIAKKVKRSRPYMYQLPRFIAAHRIAHQGAKTDYLQKHTTKDKRGRRSALR